VNAWAREKKLPLLRRWIILSRRIMQIQARYTESLICRVAMRFWVRYIAWHRLALMAIMVACLVYLLMIGDDSWCVPIFGTVLVFGIATGCAIYFVNRHRSLATLRRMAEPVVTFDFSDTGISIRSDLGGGDVSWRAITKVWKFPEAWLLFVAKGSYFTIPTESLTDEVRQFIKQKIKEHGAKIA
jgi:hypothetical protein